MRSETNFEAFLGQWRAALRSPSESWDGFRAVAELQSAGYAQKSKATPQDDERVSMFDFVLCKRVYDSGQSHVSYPRIRCTTYPGQAHYLDFKSEHAVY